MAVDEDTAIGHRHRVAVNRGSLEYRRRIDNGSSELSVALYAHARKAIYNHHAPSAKARSQHSRRCSDLGLEDVRVGD